MERQILWAPWARPGLEHVQIATGPEGVLADGLILGVKEQDAFRVHYEIRCDQDWRLRVVRVDLLSGSPRSLQLLTDGEGAWISGDGEENALPALQGCRDVDISATPFTNTLPIRRLALQPGGSAILSMVYIAAPQLALEVTQQRYTYLESTPSGATYRFESLDHGVPHFTADLPVDQDGLVLDYPGLFRRVALL